MPFFRASKPHSLRNRIITISSDGTNETLSLNTVAGEDTAPVQQLLEITNKTTHKGLSRSSSAVDNETLLLNAVAREDRVAVQQVLQTGKVDVNILRHPGLSPLHHSCINGNMIIAKLLLKYGAKINLRSVDGLTPLKYAALQGHFDLSEYLIAMGAKDHDIVNGVQKITK